MVDEIVAILIKIIAGVIVIYVIPKIRELIVSKIGTEKAKILDKHIFDFVQAADQLYKTSDPTGEIRNKYVKDQLMSLGYVITDIINAQIESKVFELGHNKDK